MSRCFGSSSDFIAKDFIDKKRNDTLYCHLKGKYNKLGNKFTTNNASVSSGKINNYKSYDMLLNLSKGYEINKRDTVTDLSSSYFGEIFTENNCYDYTAGTSNTDISNNTDIRNNVFSQHLYTFDISFIPNLCLNYFLYK